MVDSKLGLAGEVPVKLALKRVALVVVKYFVPLQPTDDYSRTYIYSISKLVNCHGSEIVLVDKSLQLLRGDQGVGGEQVRLVFESLHLWINDSIVEVVIWIVENESILLSVKQ